MLDPRRFDTQESGRAREGTIIAPERSLGAVMVAMPNVSRMGVRAVAAAYLG